MKIKIKTKFIVVFVLLWSVIFIFALVSAESSPPTMAGNLIINEPLQNGSFFISANVSQNETISSVLRADFPFNSLFAKWEYKDANLIKNSGFELSVRFLNENWSDWQPLTLDDDINGKDDSNQLYASQMAITKLTDTFQYKLIFTDVKYKDNLKNLQFSYLDTTKGPNNSFKISLKSDDDQLNIISRQDWGADESLRFDSTGAEIWPEEYYSPQKFVIHHTAGENANLDPKATIRAIYYYHAVVRGWGDIGYNYLIDSKGNVYEGRYGGEAAVGGHAYLRNRNTIGISILGCYQPNTANKKTPDCNTVDHLTEATQKALDKLIALKSQEFYIDPLTQSEFHGQLLPNVVGHRDVGQTNCPGDMIYNQLPQTRQLSSSKLAQLGGFQKPLPSAAQFVKQSATQINVEDTKTADVYVEFKNTGQSVWHGYEDDYLYIADSKLKNKLAKIGSVKIALASDKDEEPDPAVTQTPVFKLLDGNVYPGETGRFKLTLPAPEVKTEIKNFTLAWQNKGYFPESDFTITLNKIACTSCDQKTTDPQIIYSADISAATFPNQILMNDAQSIDMQFLNTGNQPWLQDKLALRLTSNDNAASEFKDTSWTNDLGLFKPSESTIQPSAFADFNFKIHAPAQIGSVTITISLLYDGQELFHNLQILDVVSNYSASITKNTIPAAVKTSWRPKVTLTFKNTGKKTWTNLILKSYDIDYTNSWFKDWSWVDSKTVKKIKQKVEPGEEISFTFRILPYWKPNTYPQVFKLYDGKNEIYLNNQKELKLTTRVDR